MPKKKVVSLRCPTCSKLVLRDEPDFPFCSDRCRLIDLGKWASGGYVISSPITDPEDIERVEKTHEEQHRKSFDKHGRHIN
ncbi:MAG TPA: DNA gyrase inhibitor YacG [Terriglobales bacterium]|nr:DNA gyrase inhibitor YacG [Terriglobales bacterium]